MKKTLLTLATTSLLVLIVPFSHAGSATWDLNPISNDWSTAANWTPDTVPNGPSDTATFGVSNQTAVSAESSIEVNGIVFSPGASAYAISIAPPQTFTISGTGVINNSGIEQNFAIEDSDIALSL